MLNLKHLFFLSVITTFYLQHIFPAQSANNPSVQSTIEFVRELEKVVSNLRNEVGISRNEINEVLNTAFIAHQKIVSAAELADQVRAEIGITDQTRADFIKKRRRQDIADKVRISKETVREKNRLGVYVAKEREKWKNIKKILSEPKILMQIASVIITIILCYYAIKHGMPVLINYFTRPCVISETSKRGWFDWSTHKPTIAINDLIFSSDLQKQLSNVLLRIKKAKTYNENLPNLLFSGAPGTGKTTFAKALAYYSGLDYALTSGSEFAKITNLNDASNELRNLFDWSCKSNKGLIVFIDEAESLFASRKFTTTPKITQDLISTFLTLISDQSQKNIMFILVTNHPFKLDESVASRMGTKIEFTLPKTSEREKILMLYLSKFSQEKDDNSVTILPEVRKKLHSYAKDLDGFSPRAIKFVAEDMVIKARRNNSKLLTNEIAQCSIKEAKRNAKLAEKYKIEQKKWQTSTMTHKIVRIIRSI